MNSRSLGGNSTIASGPSEEATRLGSLGLLLFALVSLVAGMMVHLLHYTPLSLGAIWSLSLILFFLITSSSLIFTSTISTLVLVALLGISWAVTIWVPFTVIGEHLVFMDQYAGLDEVVTTSDEEGLITEERSDRMNAGLVLGIHNIYICVPQFVSTLVSYVVFSHVKEDAFGWCIRIGGGFTLMASFLALKAASPKIAE